MLLPYFLIFMTIVFSVLLFKDKYFYAALSLITISATICSLLVTYRWNNFDFNAILFYAFATVICAIGLYIGLFNRSDIVDKKMITVFCLSGWFIILNGTLIYLLQIFKDKIIF